jgi:hypothetical protein
MAASEGDPLDFCSLSFDPVKALASDNVQVPYPKVKPLDNIARYETMLKATKPTKAKEEPKPTEFQGMLVTFMCSYN